jgi:hypothetical protein
MVSLFKFVPDDETNVEDEVMVCIQPYASISNLKICFVRYTSSVSCDEEICRVRSNYLTSIDCGPATRFLRVTLRVFAFLWPAYQSFREVGDLFKMMFPDSAVARDVTLEPTKFSYVISDGLGPYFHNILVDDIKKSASFFTVEVDGTSNVAVRHQLDMHIRFWSEKEGRVITAYYYSKMLGHATAEIMSREILNRLETDGIPIKKFLMLSCDGPSVNKLLHKMLNARVQQEKSSLVSFGSCAIHVMHHAFRKGINALGWSLDEFAVDIFYWFKHSPVRKEEVTSVIRQPKFLYWHTITVYIR